MKTETKNKIISWMVIISFCFFLSTMSYSVGHYKAEKECIEILTGIKKHLEQLTEEELLEKGYNNGWCDTNYSKRCKIEKIDGVWICHTENCTEELISAFIEGDYYNGYRYAYTYYDDFDGCYIRSVEANE